MIWLFNIDFHSRFWIRLLQRKCFFVCNFNIIFVFPKTIKARCTLDVKSWVYERIFSLFPNKKSVSPACRLTSVQAASWLTQTKDKLVCSQFYVQCRPDLPYKVAIHQQMLVEKIYNEVVKPLFYLFWWRWRRSGVAKNWDTRGEISWCLRL